MKVGGEVRLEVAEGNGPVHALDVAMRKALEPVYPALKGVSLSDYRVRILAAKEGTGAMPRVLIRSAGLGGEEWSTLGVSTNIIEASMEALVDSYVFTLLKSGAAPV